MTTVKNALAEFTLADLPSIWHDQVWPTLRRITPEPHYLVGGAITRTVINRVYAKNLPIKNYDMVVKSLPEKPDLNEDFSVCENIMGNWKVILNGTHVDVWPFSKWRISTGKTITTINEALTSVPVNVHGVLYDITHRRLHYLAEYKQGLTDQMVWVLCQAEHDDHCRAAGVTPQQDLAYRAKRFGFEYRL